MARSNERAADLQTLWEVANGLSVPTRLPRVLVMTDPRKPEPEMDWPGVVAVIYRHFGADSRQGVAERLRAETFAKGHKLLVGEDVELAMAVGADGVHFRRDATLSGPRLWRERCPDWLISMAGIKTGAYAATLDVLDGLLVSSVFPSASPSAGMPIGVKGLRERAGALNVPIFALGGVNPHTVGTLAGLPIAGVAGVGFRRTIMDALTFNRTVTGADIRLTATHMDFPGLEAELDLKGAGKREYAATHTGVPSEMEGKGVGSALFDYMVDDARANGYKVLPVCPFIVAKFKRKSETQDVMATRD